MTSSLPKTMRAWQYSSTNGGLEKNLHLNPSAALPKPKADQHLVKILAAALNPVDYKPAEMPLVARLFISKPATPGIDFVGTIVKPASNSTLKAGQLVFGAAGSSPLAGGALREYAVAGETATGVVPEGVDPMPFAGVGVAGLTAYQSIVTRVKKGDKIFINGGSGGVGMFGIQFAKAVGCHVTNSCSTPNVDLCKSLGADRVIDYKKENVLQSLLDSEKFDHVVDNVGHDRELVWRCGEFLKPGATYVRVAGELSLGGVLDGMKRKVTPGFLGGMTGKMEGFWPKPNVKDIAQIADWIKDGKVRVVVDQNFPFEEAVGSIERLKTGRARGKIVVKVAESDKA